MDPVEQRRAKYLERLNSFYAKTSEWCRLAGYCVELGDMPINEEDLGRYQAPALTISKSDINRTFAARLRPIGAAIVGGEGRVDLVGVSDSHAFLYFLGQGLERVCDRESGLDKPRSPASGLHGDDWYWLESSSRKPRLVDEELFLDLLSDVEN